MMLDLRLAMVGLSQKEKLSYTGSNPVVPLACGESVGLEAARNRCKWREIKCGAAEVEDARSMEYKDAGARDIH